MQGDDRSTRREFVKAAGVAGLGAAAGLGPVSALGAAELPEPPKGPKPDEVLASLKAGNERFVSGKLEHPGREPKDFQALAAGQAPPAIILGCADSRVAPEIIFDTGVGELFVVRVAGNMVGSGPLVKGSIEFATAVLGARLIVVLGHTECGACKSAINFIDDKESLPGAIEGVVDYIRPVVKMVAGKPGDKLTNVIRTNVTEVVKRLQGLDPILSKKVKAGELKVVGGVYDLKTGKVEMVG